MTPLTTGLKPILLYGPGAVGKSTIISQLIRKLLTGTDFKARIATVEHYAAYDSLVADGLAEVWKFNDRNQPFETVNAVMDGFWPTDPTDPLSPLKPLTKELVLRYPIRVREGIATMAGYLMGNYVIGGIADRIGKGQHISKQSKETDHIEFTDGTTQVGGIGRGDYGFGQNHMEGVIRRSQKYIGYDIWSTHEDVVVTKKSSELGPAGTTVIGPEVLGGAKTTVISREFSDVWRVVMVPASLENGTQAIERRLYVKYHADPNAGAVGIARNSRGLEFQTTVPDYLRLTEVVEGKMVPMLDVADRIVSKVWGR